MGGVSLIGAHDRDPARRADGADAMALLIPPVGLGGLPEWRGT